ncbi:MAG: hypothetical protein Q3979_09935 [Actinomycetaceae bacterium]|nr:hypothetical protein [Actinomycetaceae bacterium]
MKTPAPPDAQGISFSISDERLRAATGRSRRRWFRALDVAGAQEWDHKRIARWLGAKREVDAWWAQALTVDYERARGLREAGQGCDGSFRASASKTLRTTPDAIWPWIDDDDARREWLDCEFEVRGRTPGISLRLEAADGSRVTIGLYSMTATADGGPRTKVGVEHARLPSEGDLHETKAFWRAALRQLAEVIVG